MLGFIAQYFVSIPDFPLDDWECNQVKKPTDGVPCTKHTQVRPAATFFLLDGVDGISGICRLVLSHEAEDRIICNCLQEANRKRGGADSTLGHSGGSPLTGAALVSVRTARSQGGRYGEPQITVVIFPDCSALEANVLCLIPFSSNSLSDPSLLPDGQLGAALSKSVGTW